MGRAARNVSGKAILYADRMTDSMRAAIGETERRREVQRPTTGARITPETIKRALDDLLVSPVPPTTPPSRSTRTTARRSSKIRRRSSPRSRA
jgi:excinuclease ABC subunit B